MIDKNKKAAAAESPYTAADREKTAEAAAAEGADTVSVPDGCGCGDCRGRIESEVRIVFMGTPDFAATALDALFSAGANIVGVVTQPDKPKGRGYVMTPPPVKVKAEEKGLPCYQPQSLKGEDFAALLGSLAPEMIIVAAYGKILPQSVLDFPKYGCVNIHASLLPRWRGAAPIQRCLMEGDCKTGITTMMMDAGLDTGDVIEQREYIIKPEDNFETLHDALADIGASLIISTVNGLTSGRLTPRKQNCCDAVYASKIEKCDCAVCFCLSAAALHDRIRGLSPFPLACTTHRGKVLKITESSVISEKGCGCGENVGAVPGKVLSLDGGVIAVACGEGVLGIHGVLPEGKKRMSAADFINGRAIAVGDILGE